ncbi:MAG: GHKL domain-containing protein [Agathobacter sp.]|nr:GHKL domain-containing protein [Agathobacter sp.]
MTFLLELINTFIYLLCVINIGEGYFGYKRKHSQYRKLIMSIAVLCTTVIMTYVGSLFLCIIAHMVCVSVVLFSWFEEEQKSLLCLYLGTTIVLSVLSMLFNVVSSEVILFFQLANTDNVVSVVNHLLVLLTIRIIGKYFGGKYTNGLKNIGTKYWLLFIVIMFFDASIVLILGDFVLYTIQVERRSLLIFSYCCVVIGLLIQLVLLINTLVTRNVHKENEKLAKQFLESQNEHYQYLEKREHETKKFRHDIKNHLILLENLINNQKYDETEEYLKAINEKVSTFSNHVSVNNGIADAILNRFYIDAKEKGITLKVSGHFPMDCYITAYDICTILSNLLSNAIQAEIEADGKEVFVSIKYTDDKVLLTVENDYAHELDESGGVFKTTKKDSLGHGYGLSNVKECVERNGGYVSISTDNKRFKVMIMMLNENEEML